MPEIALHKLVRTHSLSFECASCGFSATVFVRAAGKARVMESATFPSREGFRLSEGDAARVAAMTLFYVPCPRCGAVDPAGASYRHEARMRAAVLFLVVSTVLSILLVGEFGPTALFASLGIGVLPALWYYARKRRPFSRVEERVHWPPA